MKTALKRFEALKSRVEQLQSDRDRASGVLDQIQNQLKDEFDCHSIQQARNLLRSLQAKQRKAERSFTKALERFESEHGEELQ